MLREGGRGRRAGASDVIEAEEKVFLRRSKWWRVSNVTQESREIMT